MMQRIKNAKIAGLALVLALLSGIGEATAQVSDVFSVRGIAVDVTADSSARARTQALAQGEAAALRTLLERLTLQAYHPRLPVLNKSETTALVLDFGVSDEKTSDVRYIATLNFRFKEQAIRDLLQAHAIPFAETLSKSVVVLPVYEAAGALLLWDDPNPWREAWGARTVDSALVPTVLPHGDLSDIAAIGAEQAIEGDIARLQGVAQRYGAGDSLVAHAILRMDAAGGRPELEVYVTRYGSALQEHTVVKTFLAKPGEDIGGLLVRAADALTKQIEDNWKQDNLLQFGQTQVLTATVPLSGLKDWVAVKDRLNGVAVVRGADLVLMSRTEARLNLRYIGAPEQLILSLEQADLVLWQEAGFWYLAQRR